MKPVARDLIDTRPARLILTWDSYLVSVPACLVVGLLANGEIVGRSSAGAVAVGEWMAAGEYWGEVLT